MAVYCEMVNDAFPGLTLRTVDIQVDKAVKLLPVITWPTPADISYGTPLGNGQLNATANVPGTFSYSPASGTVLEVGSNQILSVTFTPDNTDVYQQVTASVSITVKISTAVRDQESVLVKLCPNPCRDLLMVVSPRQIRRVSFVNLAGQTMLVEEAPTGRIHVASLKPGIYLVKVEDNNGKTTVLRLVKQ